MALCTALTDIKKLGGKDRTEEARRRVARGAHRGAQIGANEQPQGKVLAAQPPPFPQSRRAWKP